jgi:SAM-dependent methyltransferase
MIKIKKISFKKKKIIIKKNCVLCSSQNIDSVINFGTMPLANSYPLTKSSKEKYFNLSCVICDDCGHLQLKELVNPKLMFDNYLYVSGTSKVLVNHFKSYTDKVIKKIKLNKKSSILDIACNDGTFLNFFVKKNFAKVVGVDPAKNLRRYNKEKGIDINVGYFSSSYSKRLKKRYGEFDLITANNVFAHSPNLQDFTQGVKNLLSKNGVFVLEVSYLATVLKKKTFDTIYHEHMSYHSLKPLLSFFKRFKLEVFDFDLIKAQGGSIRVYISHKNSKKISIKKINYQIKKEKSQHLFTKKTYFKFYNKILNQKIKLRKILNNLKLQNEKIIGYGAPAKLTTLSHVLDLNKNDFDIVIDDNKLKQGRYIPGKKILIKNSNYLKQLKRSYIIILAWNFSDSIIKKCKKINNKFRFILPFPNPRIFK